MEINARQEQSIDIFDIFGELDSSTLQALLLVDKLIENTNSRLIINLENATFIDSTGVGSLLHIYNKLKLKGIPFYFVSAQGAVKRVFEVTRLEKTLPYSSSLDEAMAYLNN